MIERCAIAHQMREQGKTYKEIGEALGVSRNRAWQLNLKHHRIVREQSKVNWCDGLSTAVINKLITAGYKSKEQVHEAVMNDTKIQGIGKKGSAELMEWFKY